MRSPAKLFSSILTVPGFLSTTIACGALAGSRDGTDLADGATGIDASNSACSPGSTRCSDNDVETCGADGHWGSAKACTHQGCVAGVCTGVCTPGATQCSGSALETCGSNGQWGTPWPCATNACESGACSGSTTTGQSCAPGGAGLTNCGASQESCCTSLEVPGGSYYRTYDLSFDPDGGLLFDGAVPIVTVAADGGPTGEADPATVSGFRLDKYLVTVGRFRQFAKAWESGYMPPEGSGKHTHLNDGLGLANSGSPGTYEEGWLASNDHKLSPTNTSLSACFSSGTWTSSPGTQENLPIDCENWWEAYVFCVWDGGFLPSGAEWEYAAAGGSEQREYPWGATNPGTDNQYAIFNCNYPSGGGACTQLGAYLIAPVGTAIRGAGRWGQLDMVGEVGPWNLDRYAPYVNPCTDCAYLAGSSDREARGGNYTSYVYGLLAPYRYVYDEPAALRNRIGIRCARTP